MPHKRGDPELQRTPFLAKKKKKNEYFCPKKVLEKSARKIQGMNILAKNILEKSIDGKFSGQKWEVNTV